MKVDCNLPNGIKIFGVELAHGTNEVDPDAWQAATSRLDSRFLAGLQAKQRGDMPPYVVVHDEAPPLAPAPAREAQDEPEPGANGHDMNVRNKLRLVRAANSYDELAALETGEQRKTVLAAIYKRAEQIDRAEAGK